MDMLMTCAVSASARRIVALALLCVLSGCGGGGGSSETSEQAPSDAKSVLLTASQASDIALQQSAVQDTVLSVPSTSSVGASLAPGKTLLLPSGTDSRFPLGFAGRVSSIETKADGSKLVTLAPATLADAVQSSKISRPAVALGAENFVGVLAPAAVKPAPGAKANASQLRGDVSALGGALVVRPTNPNFLRRALSSVLPGGGTIGAASIELNAELQLAEIVDNPSLLKPYGSGANAKIALSIKLDNLKLTENHDFGNSIAGLGLKSLELHVEGDLSAEFKFVGGAEARLGFFSRAWKEVEEQSGSLFGVSAKLTGLDSKDKVGKFPIAGLVFSVPCAATSTCPIQTGNTQTPLRLAKAGGVIVWLYLMADGSIKLDGTVGLARVNDLHVLFGMQMPEGGKLDKVASFSHSSVGNVVDAPYYEGTVDVTARTGVAIDVDFFALGIRVANTSAAVLSQATLSLTGSVAHSWPAFTSPWVWTGSACARAQVGAGLMMAAGFKFGVEVDTWLGKVGSVFAYSGQWPSDDEIAVPGWHGVPIGSFGTWYSATPMTACWPAPVASSVAATVVGSNVTIAVSGTNFPDDLSLVLTNTGSCTGLHLLASGGNLVTYACTLPPGGTGALNYQLTSTKAGNLDTGALSGSIALAPVISGEPQGVSVVVGQSATFQVTAIGSAPFAYQWRRDAVAIPNATSPTYTIASATTADSGASFSVVVSNLVGSRTSASALLTVPAAGPGPFQGQRIASGSNGHTCAVTLAGGVKCWGSNFSGQLGDGTRERRLTAVDVVGLRTGITAIALATNFSCALTSAGGVKCWGYSTGDGTENGSTQPVDVLGLSSGVSAISAGESEICALTTAGGVKCWGHTLSPVDVAGLSSGVVAVAAGWKATCVITIAGGVKCWGGWPLGDGAGQGSDTPVDVIGLSAGVVAISSSGGGICALTTAGAALCWATIFPGDGSNALALLPVVPSGLGSGVAAISTSGGLTCVLMTSGGVKCWGINDRGGVGIQVGAAGSRELSPVDVLGPGSGVIAIGTGSNRACALMTSGGAKCWGYNGDGAVGDGTQIDRFTPTDVVGF